MIRFGSRGSDLALTQTQRVAEDLKERTGEDFSIEVIKTRGDLNTSQPLPEIGGKGLFTAELEDALREDRIDAAVHSLKDLPTEDPSGLIKGAIPERAPVNDVLLFRPDARDPEGGSIPLRAESIVGTSSPRRSSSVLALRSDLRIEDIRGNVETRARKVEEGRYDATILAAAGLARLGLETPGLERQDLPVELCTPAPGQGALAVQCREGDERMRGLLATIHDEETATCVNAERKVLELTGGGCSMPLGVLAQPADESGYRLLVNLLSEDSPECGFRLDLRGIEPDSLAKEAVSQLRPLLDNPLAAKSVVLLRPGGDENRLGRALGLAGARVETVAVSEILPVAADWSGLDSSHLAVLAFSSARSVDRFFEHLAVEPLDLSKSQFFAVGPATAEAVVRRGYPCEFPKRGSGGFELGTLVAERVGTQNPILFPCAQERQPDFEATLRDRGFTVEPLPVYRTVPLPGIEVPTADCLVFTSPSAALAYTGSIQTNRSGHRLALGRTTADAMQKAGIPAHGVAENPTPQALVALIRGFDHDDSTETTSPHTGDS